ncbi:hypothetical protein AOLI_G00116130 [Acnodon oligacanthus]
MEANGLVSDFSAVAGGTECVCDGRVLCVNLELTGPPKPQRLILHRSVEFPQSPQQERRVTSLVLEKGGGLLSLSVWLGSGSGALKRRLHKNPSSVRDPVRLSASHAHRPSGMKTRKLSRVERLWIVSQFLYIWIDH